MSYQDSCREMIGSNERPRVDAGWDMPFAFARPWPAPLRPVVNAAHVPMKRQFLHEYHNRLEKAHKPEYREDLRDKPRTYSYSPDIEKLRARREAREQEVRRMRRARFFRNSHQYKLGWSVDHFAQVNGLPPGDSITREAYERIKSAAEVDMEVIRTAIMNGSVRKRSIYMKGVGRLSLGVLGVVWEATGLQCDEIR
jgi:hypothetical protein